MMLKPALRPPLRAPMRGATTLREGGGVSRASQIVAHGQSGGYAGGASSVAGGWSKHFYDTISLESVNVSRPGVSVMKFLLPAGASPQGAETKIKIPATLLTGGRFDIRVYLPPLSAGSSSLEFRYSSDTPTTDPVSDAGAPAAKRMMNFANSNVTRGKWTTLSVHKSGKIYANDIPAGTAWATTGSPDPNEAEYLSLTHYTTAAVPDAARYFLLDFVAVNGYRKPFIMLGVDGFGYASHLSQMKPLMDARGFKGYVAGDGNLVAGASAKLTTFYAAGWDIISEGMNHTNYASNPSLLSGDYDSARSALDGIGCTRASQWFMYPAAGISQSTIATLDGKGVKAARAANQPRIVISELGNSDFTNIGSLATDQRTAADITPWIDDAILNGTGMILFGHDWVSTAPGANETSIAEMTTVLDYLKTKVDAGLIDVITPQQFLDRYT